MVPGSGSVPEVNLLPPLPSNLVVLCGPSFSGGNPAHIAADPQTKSRAKTQSLKIIQTRSFALGALA